MLILFVFLFWPALVWAQQTPPLPTTATVRVYDIQNARAGTQPGLLAGELMTDLTSAVCRRAPDPAAVAMLNPSRVEFADPINGAPWVCSVPLPTVPTGRTYRASVFFTAPCQSGGKPIGPCDSDLIYATTSYQVSAPDPCLTAAKAQLFVSDWTRTGQPGTTGTVSYSLAQSQQPVITIITRLDGLEQARIAGADLRMVTSSAFTLPTTPGAHAVTVSALMLAGCENSISEPMTVQVVPPTIPPTPEPTSFSDNFTQPNGPLNPSTWTLVNGGLTVTANEVRDSTLNAYHIAVVKVLQGPEQTAAMDFAFTQHQGVPRFGIVLRYQDAKNYYLLYRQSGGTSQLRISKVVNGVETVLRTANIANPSKDVFFRLQGSANGNTLTLALGGVSKLTITDPTFATGSVGFLLGSTQGHLHRADNFAGFVP